MKTIIDLRIAPTERAAVTPCELLEDFADATASWQYLEEESFHYSEIKGTSGCVLRHLELPSCTALDFLFTADCAHEHSELRLVLIDTVDAAEPPTHEWRETALSQFLDSFNAYLAHRNAHATLHVLEDRYAAVAQA